ncbi:MAG TPA: substrate-binding domain-containing protein [Lentisphaeria bacterium]|jgi:phosphate transport system substrate-binding protein|nr:substrate-binding domain-containing protein [Lentisphaeria bacterium]
MQIKSVVSALCVALSVAVLSPGAKADDFRLHGAATLAKNIVQPNQAAIESKAGLKLSVLVNGSGNGLMDLVAGKADMAMIAAPIEAEAKIINTKAPGTLDVSTLRVKQVGAAKVQLIVHPANPVKLTAAQAKDIISGKITNWKDVGGADGAILVVAEAMGQGTRAVVETVFLKGSIAANARIVPTLVQVAEVVKQSPNAVGYGNSSSITPAVSTVSGIDIPQPLSLVTKGAPTPAAEKVISAIAAHAK